MWSQSLVLLGKSSEELTQVVNMEKLTGDLGTAPNYGFTRRKTQEITSYLQNNNLLNSFPCFQHSRNMQHCSNLFCLIPLVVWINKKKRWCLDWVIFEVWIQFLFCFSFSPWALTEVKWESFDLKSILLVNEFIYMIKYIKM